LREIEQPAAREWRFVIGRLRLFVARLFVSAVALALVANSSTLAQSQPSSSAATSSPDSHAEVRSLKITILSTMLADEGIGEWGFAALVEADGKKILFDTGARPNTVL
jgi:7,8-dihydropterin-6-yl-methyl-4-(beta-D-ribofuranosyl)aminobenzene 5'-phosphate synthase